jgi:glycosyltransferase involved in cell wall biosynthesis
MRTRLIVRLCAALSGVVPSRIISCSTASVDIHVRKGYSRGRFEVIPNGFDCESFRPSESARVEIRREIGVGANRMLVGLLGRDHPQKNVPGFVEMARLICGQNSDVIFVLAGKGLGIDNTGLQEAIRQTGHMDRFRLLGPRSDVPRLLASLDILVSASTFGEAFSNVLGEAMACGVPCVATDVGDAFAIIGDRTWIVPPGDIDGLVSGVLRLLRIPDEERRSIGRGFRRRIESRFEMQSIADKYEAVLSAAAGHARRVEEGFTG